MADVEKDTLLTDEKAKFPNDGEGRGQDKLRSEIRKRYDYAVKYHKAWIAEAKEDYNFTLGEQWSEEDRQILQSQGRPVLTFNRIRPLVNVIAGYQRENASRLKVTPEGQEDKIFTEVFDRGLVYCDKVGKFTYKQGYQFDDGCACGKGWLEAVLDYYKDPIYGEVHWLHLKPWQIFVDPDSVEYDLNEDAEYVFKVCMYSKSKLLQLFPKKKRVINDLAEDSDDEADNTSLSGLNDGDDYGNVPGSPAKPGDGEEEAEPTFDSDIPFTVKEYWRKKYVTKYFIIREGEPIRFETREEAEAHVERLRPMAPAPIPQMGMVPNPGLGGEDMMNPMAQPQQIPDPNWQAPEVFERVMPEMWVAIMVGGKILQDGKSPFEPYYCGFPFFRFIADWSPSAESEKLKVMGVTRLLKDAQREKNKAKSQYLHILNTSAHSGWKGDEDALTPAGWEELKKLGSTPGVMVKQTRGTQLEQIQPNLPSQGHVLREKDADEEFKQISNINPDLLGIADKTTSGKAIGLRIRQAVTALVRIFHNYRYTKEVMGKFLISIMPMLFSARKLAKVIGPQYMQANGLDEGKLAAYLQMVRDFKYDLVISEADNTSTIRSEIFGQLIELAKTPVGQYLPPELFIDYMEINNSAEMKQKINETRQAMAQAAQQEAAMKAQSAGHGASPAPQPAPGPVPGM